jgi:hypothetical protein
LFDGGKNVLARPEIWENPRSAATASGPEICAILSFDAVFPRFRQYVL